MPHVPLIAGKVKVYRLPILYFTYSPLTVTDVKETVETDDKW